MYEPCVGTCYAHGPDFYDELKKTTSEELASVVKTIVEAHDSTCDDPEQRFGVDYDEENKIFIGSFMNGKRLDLFSDRSFLKLVKVLSNHVIKENTGKAKSAGVCNYGESGNENLAKIIMDAVAA